MMSWQERFETEEYLYGTAPNEFIEMIHPKFIPSPFTFYIEYPIDYHRNSPYEDDFTNLS
ncbi:hypothetical protein FQ085_12810 [Planococcus sp. ANT_H30]|uniref:hypothetical protein n=1 Tax=Planococcus sp. ANT_H30 TaxID=2597347 RepID=UPI0011EFD82C|nr:hypothetical protein [Planococcus sp. ANT_H30]KAA0956382.1 hypothetical protein FQ085_12810 [Planococcus sp. ANT_H30]